MRKKNGAQNAPIFAGLPPAAELATGEREIVARVTVIRFQPQGVFKLRDRLRPAAGAGPDGVSLLHVSDATNGDPNGKG